MLKRILLAGFLSSAIFCTGYRCEAKSMQRTEESAELKQAKALVQEFLDKALKIIRASGKTSEEIQIEIAGLLTEYADVERISLYVMGKASYAKIADKQSFVKFFCKKLAGTYYASFMDYKNADAKVSQITRRGKRQILVSVRISAPGKKEVLVVFSVFKTKSGIKIYDATVDNVSLSQVIRDSQSRQILQDYNAANKKKVRK